jgi:very-short-patch-repair endonuclease
MKTKQPFISYNKNLRQFSRNMRNRSTYSEVLLWMQLRARRMKGFQFNRQKPLGNFIADFYCKQLNLVIEIDGDSHRGREQYDAERDAAMHNMGLSVMRIADEDVKRDIQSVLRRIEAWIELTGKSPRPPFSKGDTV